MKKKFSKKERPEQYEKKIQLEENVTFDDLFDVAIGKEPKQKKKAKKKSKK